MLKAIAIDDEPIALDVIRSITDKVTFVEMVGYFTNAFDAMAFLNSNPVDLIFLDIKMPDITGLDFLKSIANPPMVVLTTAYSEYAVEGFEMEAVDYLLKPFSLTRFLKACNKAYEQRGLRKNLPVSASLQSFIYVKSGYENLRVDFNEILYAEACGNYVQLVLENKKIVTRLTMNEAEALLFGHGFLRAHRSYIVSIDNVQRFDKKSIWIRKTELPIGPLYLTEIEKIILQRKIK
jgi:DNA-binding LytR/AlgR family response regulator